jgi:hypothetical protein
MAVEVGLGVVEAEADGGGEIDNGFGVLLLLEAGLGAAVEGSGVRGAGFDGLGEAVDGEFPAAALKVQESEGLEGLGVGRFEAERLFEVGGGAGGFFALEEGFAALAVGIGEVGGVEDGGGKCLESLGGAVLGRGGYPEFIGLLRAFGIGLAGLSQSGAEQEGASKQAQTSGHYPACWPSCQPRTGRTRGQVRRGAEQSRFSTGIRSLAEGHHALCSLALRTI